MLDPGGGVDAPAVIVGWERPLKAANDQGGGPLDEDEFPAVDIAHESVIRLPSTCRNAFERQVSRITCIRCEAS